MTPGRYDLVLRAGAKYDRTITVRDAGTLVDWTGYSARLDLYDAAGLLLDSLVSSDLTGSRLELGGAAGTIRIYIPATDVGLLIADLGAGDGDHTLTMIPASGAEDAEVYLEGAIKVAT